MKNLLITMSGLILAISFLRIQLMLNQCLIETLH